MKFLFNQLSLACAAAGLATLVACGGGGGGGGGTSALNSSTLSGTAAIGAAISGTVYAIDANGIVSPAATTSATGAFTVNVAGMTAPFILSIAGTSGGKQVVLTSVATSVGQTVNITPLTDLIVSTAAGRPAGSALTDLCTPIAPSTTAPAACLSALSHAADNTKLNAAVTDVMRMISSINPGGTNPLTGSFVANGTGMDKVLDQIAVSPASAQSGMATVTLIATNTQIGSVTLPATAGTAATTTTTPASNSDAIAADAANTALSEIKSCMASFNALYAAPLSPPTQARVTEFIDANFAHGTMTQTSFAQAFSGNGPQVFEGFTLDVVGFAPRDMSPFTPTEIGAIDTSNNNANFGTSQRDIFTNRTSKAYDSNSNTAWVKMHPKGDPGVWATKMIKASAYPGCAGGWKLAGSLRAESHMNARINRNANGSYTRSWPFHIEKAGVIAVGGANAFVTVRGPGLVSYSGNINSPVGASTRIKLVQSPNAAYMVLADGQAYYGTTGEAIESCQDLAASANPPAAGTPCVDETSTSPGKIYLWTIHQDATTVASVFPFQTNAVPISKAFAEANARDIFATIGTTTPATAASLQALAGTDLTNQLTFNYTQGSAYGSKAEHCGIQVWNNATPILGAEQQASGANRETTCTFSTPSAIASNFSNNSFGFSGSLTSAYIRVVTTVLGNQAVSTKQLQ